MRRLGVTAFLLAFPILVGAARLSETNGGAAVFTSAASNARVVEWSAAGGPVDLPSTADSGENVRGLTVHEWGTFTSVAGPDGTAVDWLPAGGPTDLPCFVNVSHSGAKGLTVDAQGGRADRAKIRMETPVLYFYSPKEETVNVKVSFPNGMMTEWYPSATLGPVSQWDVKKQFPNVTSTIAWNNVQIRPGAAETFPFDLESSHYYAARETGSAPVRVGKEQEKFLFYRGIASFEPPISVKVTADERIAVTNLGDAEIPSIILFENRGGKVGYSVHRGLSHSSGKAGIPRPVVLNPPELTSSVESLQKDLETVLRNEGIFPREARAMVETWKDTWFEQGTRVFYIVPPRTVDSILPLEITPKPVSVARAFVGRLEVITSATREDVRKAVISNDAGMLETYGRFLEPILSGIPVEQLSGEARSAAMAQLNTIRAKYVAAVAACGKLRRGW
jgi:hypothetical protein